MKPRLLITTLGGLIALALLWLLAALPTALVDCQADVPATLAPGTPIRLRLFHRSPLPPDTALPELHVQLDHRILTAAYSTTVTLHHLSLRGPVWQQDAILYPVTISPIPPTTLTLYGTAVPLPELRPTLASSLPEAPGLPPPDNAPNTFPILCTLALFALLLIIAALLLRRHRRLPRTRLRRLPAVPDSLHAIPAILADSRPAITPATHPDFFRQLDAARFAPTPPPPEQIHALLQTAVSLCP